MIHNRIIRKESSTESVFEDIIHCWKWRVYEQIGQRVPGQKLNLDVARDSEKKREAILNFMLFVF